MCPPSGLRKLSSGYDSLLLNCEICKSQLKTAKFGSYNIPVILVSETTVVAPLPLPTHTLMVIVTGHQGSGLHGTTERAGGITGKRGLFRTEYDGSQSEERVV